MIENYDISVLIMDISRGECPRGKTSTAIPILPPAVPPGK